MNKTIHTPFLEIIDVACQELSAKHKDDVIEPYKTLMKKLQTHYKGQTSEPLEMLARDIFNNILFSDNYHTLINQYHIAIDTVNEKFGRTDEQGFTRNIRPLFSIITDTHEYFPEELDIYVENMKSLPTVYDQIYISNVVDQFNSEIKNLQTEYHSKIELIEKETGWELDPTYSDHPRRSHIEKEIQEKIEQTTKKYKQIISHIFQEMNY